MRIIAGNFKGRKLGRSAPGVRPTSDRLRESLFNVLGPRVEGSFWVDAFAGSGAVGIEAISRGASHVVFNDHSSRSRAGLENNLVLCRISSGFKVYRQDAVLLFRRLRGRPVDFVFLDPPYDSLNYDQLLAAVHGALAESSPGHLVLLEVSSRTSDEMTGDYYEVVRRIRAGDSHILMLEPVQSPDAETPATP